MFMVPEIISVPTEGEILTADRVVFAGATAARNVLQWGTLAGLTAIYPFNHRRADSGPSPQIPLTIQEVLPHPSGLTGGGIPDPLCR